MHIFVHALFLLWTLPNLKGSYLKLIIMVLNIKLKEWTEIENTILELMNL